MGLSTTYTKVETDYKLQELQKFIVSELKGTLKITDTAPTVKGLYILSDVGTYTNLGGLVTTTGKINYAYFNGTTWSKVEVSVQRGKSAYEVAVDNGFVGTEAQWLASLKPAVSQTMGTSTTDIMSQKAITDEFKRFVFNTGKGLPMVLKSSVLTNLTSENGVGIITPQMFNNFLWDFKLKGTPESGFTYTIGTIQYNNAPSAPYENYLSIQKVSNAGVKTVIGHLYLPSTLQRGVGTYNFTLTSASSTVTMATIVLNWEALLGVDGKYNSIYDTYRFDNDYLFNQNSGYLADKLGLSKISDDANKALSKVTTSETTTWQLANDNFTGVYGYRNIGQHTKRMSVATSFSQVNLQKVAYNGIVTYKVYIVNELATRNSRDTPTGVISETTHTLLKEGTIVMTDTQTDYKISLGDAFICPVGSQVVVYMSASDTIHIGGVSGGSGAVDSNTALLSTSSTPFSGGSWSSGSFNNTTNTGWFNLALKLVNAPLFKVAGANDVVVENYLKLTIPSKIYAVVGTEINLYNDAISYSIDRGLVSPLNYQTKWTCNKGTIIQRGFRFTPLAGDIGTHNCTCEIYDMNNVFIASKTFQIVVQSKSAPTTIKRVVYFGDSLGLGVAEELYNNFNNTAKYSGAIPIFAGTKGTTKKYEAVGGYRWADYATAGRRAFRVQVSGIGAVTLNSTYTNNGFTWTVIEVNVTGGNGNLLITKQDTGGSDAPTVSGNLVSTTGGATISYTSATLEVSNPLWNSTTNAIDIPLYKSRLGLQSTDKIDVVSFQFGINDNALANDLPTLLGYITSLYNAFIADNPTCKFIIGLPTSAGNTVDGSGANYGAMYNWKALLENTYKIRQYLLTLEGSVTFPNLIISAVSLGLDRYYGYNLSDRPVSERNSTTEKYHTNHVHPQTSGYGQMADMYFGTYLFALT